MKEAFAMMITANERGYQHDDHSKCKEATQNESGHRHDDDLSIRLGAWEGLVGGLWSLVDSSWWSSAWEGGGGSSHSLIILLSG